MFEREGVQLDLTFVRPLETPALLLVTATTTNSSREDVTHFVCQAAVPKVWKNRVQPCVVAHACNSRAWEVEAGESLFEAKLGYFV